MFFFADKEVIPAILPTILGFTNVFSGIVGFYTAWSYIDADNLQAAHTLWVRSYAIVFGILGFGYRRTLYAGTAEEWKAEKVYDLVDFFKTETFYTVAAIGVVLLLALAGPQLKWFWKAGNRHAEQVEIWNGAFATWFGTLVIGVLGYATFIFGFRDEEQRVYFVDKNLPDFGFFAPLVGFLVAQTVYFALISFVLLVPTHSKRNQN